MFPRGYAGLAAMSECFDDTRGMRSDGGRPPVDLVLGKLADHTSIDYVFRVCSFLPLIGLLAVFLPDMRGPRPATVAKI